MRHVGEFMMRIELGDTDVPVQIDYTFVETGRDKGELTEAAVTLAFWERDHHGEYIRYEDGTPRINYVDLYDVLPDEDQRLIHIRIMDDVAQYLNEGGEGDARDREIERQIDERVEKRR
jgi:hypothetical protein